MSTIRDLVSCASTVKGDASERSLAQNGKNIVQRALIDFNSRAHGWCKP